MREIINGVSLGSIYDTPLKIITGLMLIAAIFILFWVFPNHKGNHLWYLYLIVPGLCIVSALFMITGYTLTTDSLIIKRPLGLLNRTIARSEIKAIESDKSALSGAIRLFGSGGLFSYVGIYNTKQYGKVHAYVTSRKDIIVVKLEKEVILISPKKAELLLSSH